MSVGNYSYDCFNVTFPREGVAHVEIYRPRKLNAFVEAMWVNLAKIFTRLSTDPDVRCVVLSGAGERGFSAGLDVQAAANEGVLATSEARAHDVARKAFPIRRHILDFQDCVSAIEKCEKPTIVLLHGICYGLAIDISSAADIRLCSNTPPAQFCVKEVDIGLAADIGTLTRLPKIVGSESWAKEVCLSARVWGAEEAARVGFVGRVIEGGKERGLEEALDLASLIASKSPVAVQGTKHLMNYSRDHAIADGLNYTATWNAAMIQTQDVKDAMLSGLKKKTPKFSKL